LTGHKLLKRLEPAKGIEPPTYGLRIRLVLLTANQINNLGRQIRNKFGKIRNTRATRIEPLLITPSHGLRRKVRNDSEPSINRFCPVPRESLHWSPNRV
jgi:hypothetical protein